MIKIENAKKEFLEDTQKDNVLCASIFYRTGYGSEENKNEMILKCAYTKEEYEDFLNKLDFDYDDGFGGQELYGIIICQDGVWFERGEYDGSEWWERHKYPEIPDECKRTD